jgi:hypothetical protein
VTRAYQRRKVAPKVRDGAVQKKHRHQPTTGLGYVIDRKSPAKGCRHVLTKRDIRDLAVIIPNWAELSAGIESIILTRAGIDHVGRYEFFPREKTASIQIPAWAGDLWTVFTPDYFDEHRAILERIGVAFGPEEDGIQCRFTLAQARAFLLLHVFLHELDHHVDRMQSKQQNQSRRGEPFAERYANELGARIWPDYVRVFGDPRRT